VLALGCAVVGRLVEARVVSGIDEQRGYAASKKRA
jgi:hypothetical protein